MGNIAFPAEANVKEENTMLQTLTKEQLLNWDIRAIHNPEIFEQWLNTIAEEKTVSTELIYTKMNGQYDLMLNVYYANTQEELEEITPDFFFSYSWLEEKFWGFVSAAAKSKATFDAEFFFDQLAGYC